MKVIKLNNGLELESEELNDGIVLVSEKGEKLIIYQKNNGFEVEYIRKKDYSKYIDLTDGKIKIIEAPF
jgi:hypothetical protein